MKDTIFNAINKAIFEVLSTDINDHDVDFDNDEINNQYIHHITFDDIRLSKISYPDGIFKTDTRPYITYILPDNTEISPYQYTEEMNPIFLKIGNEEMIENHTEILINTKNKRHCIKGQMQWQDMNNILLDNDLLKANDYNRFNIIHRKTNGYENCNNLLNAAKQKNISLPAIEYCKSLSFMNAGIKYEGYLPSYEQLKFINNWWHLIHRLINRFGQNFADPEQHRWWTSSEYSADKACQINKNGFVTSDVKTSEKFVMPIFKKMSKYP